MNRLPVILASLLLPATLAAGQAAPAVTAGGPQSGESQLVGRDHIPDRMEPLPPDAVGVSVEEHFGAKLPMDATFTDESGKSVTLAEMFKSDKPVVLQLGYMSCPKLCDIISEKTADGLAEVPLQMGRDYNVVYVSIDPNEKPALAAEKKRNYIARYTDGNRHEAFAANEGWKILTGDRASIDRVATAIGFNYHLVETTQQYAHPAVLTLVTPDGRVSSYLYGAGFDPVLLKVAIVRAATGKTTSVMDRIIMTCLHFDPNTGKYSDAAMRVMRVGGVVTVAAILSTMGLMAMKGRRLRGVDSDRPAPTRGLAAVLASDPGPRGAPADFSNPSPTATPDLTTPHHE